MGRKPCRRSRSRCARTFSRDGLRRGRAGMLLSPRVTCNLTCRASQRKKNRANHRVRSVFMQNGYACITPGFVARSEIRLFGIRRAKQVDHRMRTIGPDAHGVDYERIALVMADGIAVP